MLFTCFIVYSLSSNSMHAIFNKDQSKLFVKLWKPESVVLEGNSVFLNTDSIDKYAKAHILLEKSTNAFTIVTMKNSRLNIFICSRSDEYVHQIDHALWSPYMRKSTVLQEAKEWHEDRFSDYIIKLGKADESTQSAWNSIV